MRSKQFIEYAEQHIMDRADLYRRMAKAMSCGACGGSTTVDSEFSCKSCGRMLCMSCGIRWGVCKDHLPLCCHPSMIPTQWDQPRPAPARVVGQSRNNYSCPVCGFGVGSYPDPSGKELAAAIAKANET